MHNTSTHNISVYFCGNLEVCKKIWKKLWKFFLENLLRYPRASLHMVKHNKEQEKHHRNLVENINSNENLHYVVKYY